MITILAVGSGTTLAVFGEPDPSVEILTACGADEALEILARNRRIDAVLLLGGAATTAKAIREEDPAGPPLFAPAGAGEIPGVEALASETPEALAAEIARRLEA
ncbi:MAG: hypothetical protein ACM3NW_11995 [Syntrophomonadaceae bacterium]